MRSLTETPLPGTTKCLRYKHIARLPLENMPSLLHHHRGLGTSHSTIHNFLNQPTLPTQKFLLLPHLTHQLKGNHSLAKELALVVTGIGTQAIQY